jgi:hypothetical protein
MKHNETQKSEAVTPAQYRTFQQAFDFFNAELFEGALPHVLVTLQRHANTYGYYSHDRFSGRVAETHVSELALNPDGFYGRNDEAILATLVHEQCHVWQYAHGTPSARGYHNREWSAKMKAIGLQPTSTGMVGGKETGQRMSHLIIPNGSYAQAYAKLAKQGLRLEWQSTIVGGGKGKDPSKIKFTCSQCGQNVWGKETTAVDCHNCQIQMEAAG